MLSSRAQNKILDGLDSQVRIQNSKVLEAFCNQCEPVKHQTYTQVKKASHRAAASTDRRPVVGGDHSDQLVYPAERDVPAKICIVSTNKTFY